MITTYVLWDMFLIHSVESKRRRLRIATAHVLPYFHVDYAVKSGSISLRYSLETRFFDKLGLNMSIYHHIDKKNFKISFSPSYQYFKFWNTRPCHTPHSATFGQMSQHLLLQKIMEKKMVLVPYLQKPAFLQYFNISKKK